MPELYRRPSGDVNNPRKAGRHERDLLKDIRRRRLRGSKDQPEMGDNPVYGLMKGTEQPL
jgi:hypothetical protein